MGECGDESLKKTKQLLVSISQMYLSWCLTLNTPSVGTFLIPLHGLSVNLLRPNIDENEISLYIITNCSLNSKVIRQPRPQGLLLIQNGSWRNPWPWLPKWLQKFVRISSCKHDEMSSFCLNNGFPIAENKQGCQTLETTSEKAISSCVMWQNTP